MKNIIVAFPDHPTAQKIRTILAYNGFNVSGVCTSGSQVIAMARRLQGGGIVICPYKFNDMTTEFLSEQLVPDYDCLSLVHPNELIVKKGNGIFSLVLPLKKSDLLDSVRMLYDTGSIDYWSGTGIVEEKADYKDTERKRERTPEERKMIEDAKAILMDRNNLTEEQAHRFLQKHSMNKGHKLTDTAKAVIDGWY